MERLKRNERKIKWLLIVAVMALWIFGSGENRINGLFNGIYHGLMLLVIFLFLNSYRLAVMWALVQYMVLVVVQALNNEMTLGVLAEKTIQMPEIIIILIAIAYFTYKDKIQGYSLYKHVRETSVYTKMIMYSLVLMTGVAIAGDTGGDLGLVIYTMVLQLAIVIALVMNLEDFLIFTIIQSLLGIIFGVVYARYIDLNILLIITHVIVLASAIYELGRIDEVRSRRHELV